MGVWDDLEKRVKIVHVEDRKGIIHGEDGIVWKATPEILDWFEGWRKFKLPDDFREFACTFGPGRFGTGGWCFYVPGIDWESEPESLDMSYLHDYWENTQKGRNLKLVPFCERMDTERFTSGGSEGRSTTIRCKPVVFVWGFYPGRFGPVLAHRIIDFFKTDGRCGATLVGGVPWYWRREEDPEWARAFRRFDVLSPWNVGNYTKFGEQRHASTGSGKDDLAEAKRAGMAFLPVIHPGFGWANLKGKGAANQTLPRLGGEFFWRQFSAASDLGIDMAYVAIFDEVAEGTAIFKVSNSPPTQARFQIFEGLPSD